MPLSLDGTTGISASGNITAAYLFGNASGLSGISSNKIFNGTSEANIGTSGGNANVSIGGTANVAVFTTGGLTVTGFTATGNSTLGNLTITGSRTIDVGNNRISNLAEPSAGTDAATKDYVDSVSSSGFTIEDDTANTTVVSGGDTLELFGTANQVQVAVTATDRVTVSLPANVTVPNNLSVTGNVTTTGTVNTGPLLVTGNVSVTGNIAVTGNVNYSNVTDLVVGDPLIFLGANNTGNIYDLGFIVTYDDGLDQHGGWVRDATDGTWKLFGNVVAEPTTTVDFTNALYQPMRAGNVTAGNVLSSGVVSATGNVTGSYILGNGSQLTGIDATSIQSGTSNVRVVSSGGNVSAGIGGTSNVMVLASTGQFVTGLQSVTGNVTGGNILTAGVVSATGNITGSFILGNGSALTGMYGNANVVANLAALSSNPVSTTGNVTAGNFLTGGLISATGNITGGNIITGGGSGGNITGANVITATTLSATGDVIGGNITTAGLISATGNVSGGNLNVTGNIVDTGALSIITGSNGNITLNAGTGFIIASSGILNGQANGTGNIGNSTGYFNTIFAKATSAQYADLAENYLADAAYEPGTVVIFGGTKEVTQSISADDHRVAGVVSTRPSHLMNAGLTGDHVVALALQGRVPCRVAGLVARGDLLVSGPNGRAQANNQARAGTIIGKALQDSTGADGVIEIAVGRD